MAKTKALFNFAVTPKLICGFVFVYAKGRFSHDVAHIVNLGITLRGMQCVSYFCFKTYFVVRDYCSSEMCVFYSCKIAVYIFFAYT